MLSELVKYVIQIPILCIINHEKKYLQWILPAREAGQYKIYCPANAFDPPTQSVTFIIKGSVRYRWNAAIKESNSFDRCLDR